MVLGIKENLVECATEGVKSVVILTVCYVEKVAEEEQVRKCGARNKI